MHITTPDIGVRRRSWDAVRFLVDFCREGGGSLVVLGSGKQRGTQGISRDAATAILREELAGLVPHLKQSGVTLLLEPLQVQVTDVLNGLHEARAIVDGHHPSLVGRPGRARSEYAAAFRVLAAKGYAGWISLETFHAADSPETVLAETRAFLENMTSVLPGHTSGPKRAPLQGGN